MTYMRLAFIAYCAITIPLAAAYQQWRYIAIVAAAEDECPFFWGAYELDDVVGIELDGRHAVECRYR